MGGGGISVVRAYTWRSERRGFESGSASKFGQVHLLLSELSWPHTAKQTRFLFFLHHRKWHKVWQYFLWGCCYLELSHGWSQARSEKGGGSSVGPAPQPRKENYATETCTTNENNTSVLEEAGPGLPGRMTCCGESRKEATMPMTLLSTRKTLKLRTSNMRTMYEAGKTFPTLQQKCRDLTSPYSGYAKPDGPSQDNCG